MAFHPWVRCPSFASVQSERFWKLEAVLFLAWGLAVSIFAGMMVVGALRRYGPQLSMGDERFLIFVVSTVSFQGGGLLLSYWFVRQHDLSWRRFLGLQGPRLGKALLLALAVVVVSLPVIVTFNELMRVLITRLHSEPEMQPTMQILEISVSPVQRFCFGMTAIVLAPLVEEILFRGILYRFLQQRGFPTTALLGTALLFGLIHGSWMTLLPLAALAVIFALLYDKTGNLLAPIFAHSVFNAVNFFGYVYRDDINQWWKQTVP